MNDLFSYCGLVDVIINASDKDLPVLYFRQRRQTKKYKIKPSLLQEFQIEVMSAVALPNPI